jgi:hypothetical protein
MAASRLWAAAVAGVALLMQPAASVIVVPQVFSDGSASVPATISILFKPEFASLRCT